MSAIRQICEEKELTPESVIETIEAALAAAYRKDYGQKNQNIKVKFNPETGGTEVWDEKEVVEDELKEETERMMEEAKEAASASSAAADTADKEVAKVSEVSKVTKEEGKTEEGRRKKEEGTDDAEDKEEPARRYNPKNDIILSDAKDIKEDAKVGDVITMPLPLPSGFGRMAAQTAKQVIIQKLREAERTNLYATFKDKEGEVVSAVVQRREGGNTLMDIGKVTGILPYEDQIRRERYQIGDRYKVYIKEVNSTAKGPEIVLSRIHPSLVKEIFTTEIPEIANGLIEVKNIAREAGARSKVAVETTQENIDPIGSCVGQRGTRVQTIINELGGEKIDIIEYEEEPQKYIANALAPAKISSIDINEEEKSVVVKVKEDQLSLAIGRGGQNVRLAAQLTGWKIDIVKELADGQEEQVTKDGEVLVEAAEATEAPGGGDAEKSDEEVTEVAGGEVKEEGKGKKEDEEEPEEEKKEEPEEVKQKETKKDDKKKDEK